MGTELLGAIKVGPVASSTPRTGPGNFVCLGAAITVQNVGRAVVVVMASCTSCI